MLPREDTIVKTRTGEIGKVQRLHLLNEQFDMLTNKGFVKRFTVDEFSETLTDYKFPRKFDHISNETQTVVGLDSFLFKRSETFKDELEILSKAQPEYAHNVFDKLFEGESLKDNAKEKPSTQTDVQVNSVENDEETPDEPIKSKLYREPSDETPQAEEKAGPQKSPENNQSTEELKMSPENKPTAGNKDKKPYKGKKNNNWRNKKKNNSDKKQK